MTRIRNWGCRTARLILTWTVAAGLAAALVACGDGYPRDWERPVLAYGQAYPS